MTDTDGDIRTIREYRPHSAREIAEALGVSKRTVTRRWSEPRQDFLNRAAYRRAKVLKLREEGLTFPQIGERLGISTQAAKNLAQRAKAARERASA